MFIVPDSHFANVFDGVKPVLQLVILMVVACSIILGLPRRGSHWLFLNESIYHPNRRNHNCRKECTNLFVDLLSGFPRDVRRATEHFNVESKSTIYAACPRCHAIYPPEIVDGISTYRQRCNFTKYGTRCKELLIRPRRASDQQIFVPIKPFITFDMQDWMANLLSRRGYEEKMDEAWSRMQVPADGVLRDIFQGSLIRGFKGPDKRTHFSSSGGANAGRYLFSLGADFFNPLGNKTAGKKISLGVIALVCVNLPIEIRYKPENMFLAGIIPGPDEPALDDTNHYMKPLVDVLLLFWKGIKFSKTSLYPHGRLILLCAHCCYLRFTGCTEVRGIRKLLPLFFLLYVLVQSREPHI